MRKTVFILAAILAIAVPGIVAQTNNKAVTPVAHMANAYKLCDESDIITAMPVGTVFQFGKDETDAGLVNTWLPPETSNAAYPALPFTVLWTDWPTNPTPETKQLDVQQTSVAQTFMVQFYGSSAPVAVVVPALASTTPPPANTTPPPANTTPAPTTNSCSTNNTSCTTAMNSDAAHIITTSGDTSLNPTETATLKAAIQSVQQADAAAQAAESNLQSVQKTIAANHGANAAGPYQISTDFDTTISQIPPSPVAITATPQ